MSSATRRAVTDVLAQGPRGDLAESVVGIELGQHLQSALTTDVAEGAGPGELVRAMREACGQNPTSYARILELIVLAGLDEQQILADLPGSELRPVSPEVDVPSPRRPRPRRR